VASPRLLTRVQPDGSLLPVHPERLKRRAGQEVWVSLHQQPALGLRSNPANARLWAVLYAAIARETGNDPDSIHEGLKREAVRVGVLEPQYIVIGDRLLEDDPTTRTDPDTFSRFMDWVEHFAVHDLGISIGDER
jgi:hypothetical protein